MTGHHSKGEQASHPLIPIRIAYNEAVEQAGHDDSLVPRRYQIIEDKLKMAELTMRGITENFESVKNEITRIAETAIDRALTLAGQKALIVRSWGAELIRKRNELESMRKFLRTHKSSSGPLAFLRAFDRYMLLAQSLETTADLPTDAKIEGDLTVFGGLEVSTTDAAPLKGDGRVFSTKTAQVTTRSTATPFDSVRRTERGLGGTDDQWTSLIDLAQRKEQKNNTRGIQLTFQPFEGSAILKTTTQCRALYLCFPFKGVPQTHLLYSTERDGRSIAKMHQQIDGIGITAILVKSGDYIFGGFAAAKWTNDGHPFGEKSSSFLFSISQDAYIPYRPRCADACRLYATAVSLTFGRYDLILADDFDGCSAVIENSYGVGFRPGSTEASTFLAGSPLFKADIVEVWGFFTTE
jgi:hypothetical protein